MLKAKGRFLGRVKVHTVIGDHILGDEDGSGNFADHDKNGSPGQGQTLQTRNIYLPIGHDDGSNPDVEVKNPYPGIFIYRFSEGFNYPNANHYLDQLTNHIFANTRRTNPNSWPRPGDRPWNDPGPRPGQVVESDDHKPTLKAIILDFSSVNNVDITSVQQLIDVRNQLDKYTSPEAVDWHLACINNRWTKRALVSAGFGYPSTGSETQRRWKPIFSVAEIGGSDSAAHQAETLQNEKVIARQHTQETQHHKATGDAITSNSSGSSQDGGKGLNNLSLPTRTAVVHGLNRPLFHIDLTSALESAVANVEERREYEVKGGPGTGELP